MKVKYKIGHHIFTIGEDDRVIFNGNSYILRTKTITQGWHKYSPNIAKGKAKKLLSQGVLIETTPYTSTFARVTSSDPQYKFDLEKLSEHIKENEK